MTDRAKLTTEKGLICDPKQRPIRKVSRAALSSSLATITQEPSELRVKYDSCGMGLGWCFGFGFDRPLWAALNGRCKSGWKGRTVL